MVLTSTSTTAGPFVTNGTNVSFQFLFMVSDPSDVSVYHTNASGETTQLTGGVDYTVSTVAGITGGTVITSQALDSSSANGTLLIKREVAITQNAKIRNQSAFYPSIHEDALDKLTMIDQQQQEQVDRSIKVANGTGLTLEIAEASPGCPIGWDPTGTKLINLPTSYSAYDTALGDADDLSHGDALIAMKQHLTGAVRRTSDSKAQETISVMDFGAAGDGVTDDTTAINNAITAISTLTAPRLIFPTGVYKITSNINFTVPDNTTIEFIGTLSAAVGNGITAVTFGSSGKNTNHLRVKGLWLNRSTGYDTSSGSIGVKVQDCVYSDFDIRCIQGFTFGLYLYSESGNGGISYCQFKFGTIRNNAWNLYTQCYVDGYINENNFYGGSFAHDSNYGVSSSSVIRACHVYLSYFAASPLNNNRFFGPSFENHFTPYSFNGTISGTTLTVNSGTAPLQGMWITGGTIPAGTYISSGTGPFTLANVNGASIPSQSNVSMVGMQGVAALISGQQNIIFAPRMENGPGPANYQIQFSDQSAYCQLLGLGFNYWNVNIYDSGAANCYQTRDGMTLQSSSAASVLQIANTNSTSNHLWSGKNGTASPAVETSWIDGDGKASFAGAIAIGNLVSSSSSNSVTNKVKINIGGTWYYLLASTSNS